MTVRATMDLKPGAHTLYLLGAHADSVAASQYLETVHGLEAGRVPALDLGLEQVTEHIRTIGLFRTKAKNLLETCRILVEQHGGSISVDSKLGQGTTFTVRLPALEEPED